jgi:hypothetical protein
VIHVEDWAEIRRLHRAEVHSLKGESYRLRGRDLGRVPATDND